MSHDAFRTERDNLGLWRAKCEGCGWEGPARTHPLDCGSDAVEHSREAETTETTERRDT